MAVETRRLAQTPEPNSAKLNSGQTENTAPVQPTRWDACYSWLTAGYNIGWDLGQGLVLFIPKGLLQPFHHVTPQAPRARHRTRANPNQHKWWSSLSKTDKFNYYSKSVLENGLLTPAMLLAQYLVSPLLGAMVALLAMLPGLVGGFIFKQSIKNQEYHYAMEVVNQHSATAVWGALLMGLLLTYSYLQSGFSLPAFTLPSISLYAYTLPALSISAFWANWILPLAAAYGLMVLLSVGQSFMRIYDISEKFALYSGKSQKWPYTLKGTVDYEIQNDLIKEKLHTLFQSELNQMSERYETQYDQLRQQLERDPTAVEMSKTGVLSQYQLLTAQRSLIKQIKAASTQTEQLALIQTHTQSLKLA